MLNVATYYAHPTHVIRVYKAKSVHVQMGRAANPMTSPK